MISTILLFVPVFTYFRLSPRLEPVMELLAKSKYEEFLKKVDKDR
ncbi:MAG: hypothetical protein WD555_02870 [Fulvivirga sp.]